MWPGTVTCNCTLTHTPVCLQVELPTARKSVGAEVNYGIRFSTDADAIAFLYELSKEVAKRLDLCGARGRTITLKLKRRRADAPVEPPKFLGHGLCDNASRSLSHGSAVASAEAVFAAARELFAALAVPPAEVRGVGISVARLDGQPQRGAGVSLPADMHVSSLRTLWGAGGPGGDPAATGGGPVVEVADEGEGSAAELPGDGSPGSPEVDVGGAQVRADGSEHALDAEAGQVLDAGLLQPAEPTAALNCVGVRVGGSDGPGNGIQGAQHGRAEADAQATMHQHAPEGLAEDVGPMQAIPDFHALDMSVVDSLPAPMRLELMRAYGLHSKAAAPQLRGGRQPAAGTGAARGKARATPQKRAPPRAEAAARRAPAAAALPLAPRKRVRVAMHGLTLSQVDAGVLAELPADVQAGLREGLPESRGAFRQVQAADELATRGGPGLIHAVQVWQLCW